MDAVRRSRNTPVWKLEEAARRSPEAQGEKSIRPAGCQFVQPVMVCFNQTIIIEIVQREAPDSLANCVELAVDVFVGATKVQPFQLGGIGAHPD